ncbi:hypothetical protein [Lactiplantibacillus plantarum]|uniref:hypothetical protein n=1 Tax=Lactiplantibacillus plantarum TaxID=1590 RepID=UPI000C7EEE22|nr:hypothetical protein [Lactiplantibacillus plantarum]WAU28688.1 hypothetical protein OR568_00244 [Lactiplantibacillus plantarum]
MSTQSQITQTQVLDAISRAALMLERQDAAQSGLQLLLNEFRRSLLQTSGQAATTVLYHGKIKSYLLQYPSNYPDSVAALSSLLDHFVAAQ